jgi:hypothetical protein
MRRRYGRGRGMEEEEVWKSKRCKRDRVMEEEEGVGARVVGGKETKL